MTRLTAFLLFLIICELLSSCSQDREPEFVLSESERSEIHSDVINRFHAMIKYSEAGELENVLSHFDPAGPGSYIDDGTRYSSFEEMAVHYRATWKIRKQDYGVPDTRVYVLSSRAALVVSSATLSTTHRDGVSFKPRPWSASILWEKSDGEWLIHSFHQYSGVLAPIEENPDR